jgi:hypothetical protein
MTTEVTGQRTMRRALDLSLSILFVVVGLVVLILEGVLDVLLLFTSADSPGDVEGATDLAFQLLTVGGVVWLVVSIVAIILMVRRRTAWWAGSIAILAPIGCTIGGFLAVTSVVQ